MPSIDGADYPHVAQLLDAEGEYFSAMVAVQKLLPVYTRQYSEAVMVGTNAVAFANIGDGQDYIDSFTIECWGRGAYREVKEAIALEATHGYFTLRVPSMTNPEEGDLYLVRFYEANMGWMYPRRDGVAQVFPADIENIEVHGHETY